MGLGDNVLKNFSLFVDGRGFAGEIEEFNPPKLALKMEEFRSGGMDAPVDIDMGMEKLTTTLTLSGITKEALVQFGVSENNGVNLTARGALVNLDGSVKPVVIQMRGTVNEVEEGAWAAGNKTTLKLAATLNYYKRDHDGETIYEIDVLNMIRNINGVDQLEAIRNAIGV
ncbi:MAG: phage major tail tube protein [Desulfovibrio sp.]